MHLRFKLFSKYFDYLAAYAETSKKIKSKRSSFRESITTEQSNQAEADPSILTPTNLNITKDQQVHKVVLYSSEKRNPKSRSQSIDASGAIVSQKNSGMKEN